MSDDDCRSPIGLDCCSCCLDLANGGADSGQGLGTAGGLPASPASPSVSHFRQLRNQLMYQNLNTDKLNNIMRQDSLESVVRDPCFLLNEGVCNSNSNIDQTMLSILLFFHSGWRRVRREYQAELGPGGLDQRSVAALSLHHCIFVLARNAQQPSVKHQAATVEPEHRLGRHHGSVSQTPGSGLPHWGHAAFSQDAVRSPAERDAADAAQVLLSLPALWLPDHELLATVLARSVQEAGKARLWCERGGHRQQDRAGDGSRQEPPDVCRARGGGDPQGADQRAGGEEQPAGEGELPAEEPGQPRAAGEVPVSHPHGRAAGQPQLPGRAATAAEPSSLRRLCCVSGSALGRAEPLPLDKSGPPTLNQKLCDVANRRVPFRRKAKRRGCKMIDGTQMNCWDSDKHNIELVML